MSDKKNVKPEGTEGGLTRRDLLRTVGLSAGGVALGLSTLGRGSTANAAVGSKAYAAGNALIEIDGVQTYLKSAAGGNAVVQVVPEPSGDGILRKRPGAITYDDLVFEIPLSMPPSLLGWINSSLTKGPSAKNGAIVYLDFNFNEVKRLEFFNAVITEVGLPAFDAGSKEQPTLSIKLSPELARLAGPAGTKPTPKESKSQTKPLISSAFRLNIQGLEAASQKTQKISAVTAKRALPAVDASQRMKERLFGPLDCSLLTVTVGETWAGPYFAWLNEQISGKGTERPGRVELLTPDLTTVLATIDYGNLGIVRYAPTPVTAGAETLATVQVDMYCETVAVTIL